MYVSCRLLKWFLFAASTEPCMPHVSELQKRRTKQEQTGHYSDSHYECALALLAEHTYCICLTPPSKTLIPGYRLSINARSWDVPLPIT
ncbi:hypothetical protein F4859DRAFT_476890 [Xylaria cf. heliscus]|nr:hypothetical protein F4859DRAFT_476890 [Xylaria cf. heliscus]